LVVLGWVSSVTMLVPWPPATMALFEAHNVELAHWAVWVRWALNAIFILGGAISAFLALRGRQRALRYAVAFSAIYIAYWLSEYVLARGPAVDVISSVMRQVRLGGLASQIVIIQHQIVLPIFHLIFIGFTAFKYGKRRYAI
jgi:hypothetical protein